MPHQNRCFSVVLVLVALLSTPADAAAPTATDVTRWKGLYEAGTGALSAKKFKVAETNLEQAFEIAQHFDASDARHRLTLQSLVNLYIIQRQWAAAEPWAEKIVILDEDAHGKEHVEVSYSLAKLAEVYLQRNRFAFAEKAYLRALKIRSTAKQADQDWALNNNLAETYRRWGKDDKAATLYQQVIALKEAKLGKDDPALASTLNDLGLIAMRARQYPVAQPLFERAHGLSSKLAKTHLAAVGSIKNNLGNCYKMLGRHAEAEKLYVEAIGIAKASKPVDKPGLGNSHYNLANLYAVTKRYDKAAASYQEAIKVRKDEYGSKSPRVRKAEEALADVLDRLGKPGEAAAIRAKHKP